MPSLLTPSRRQFLTAGLSLPFLARAARTSGSSPIQHVLIACNENRSFDHYYGFAPFAGSYGLPSYYAQPDGHGGFVAPYHLPLPVCQDPNHDWKSIHSEWDNGKMDGFFTTNGSIAVGYYNQSDLPFYYSLFDNFTLCANYFCSLLGPTNPNRLYLIGGTSGGNTTNNIAPGSLNYPIILDLLDAYQITWKVYHISGPCSISGPICENTFQLFQKWQSDPRVNNYYELDYYADLKSGNLPQVSFIQTWDLNDEHPPTSINVGQNVQQKLISALMQSPLWQSSAYIFTYDEAGGFFDHIAPPVFDAYGAGVRVPTWIISPYAKPGHLETTLYEHASILKFVETTFGLPTLASIDHQFDQQTPGVNNDAANGQPYGPPAPPRDGRPEIGDLTQCFTFGS
jgi:phospholipase C